MGPVELRARYLGEPLLEFASGGLHDNPKAGIARFGPNSLGTPRHPRLTTVGFIGPAQTVDDVRSWLARAATGLPGNDKHPAFPGYATDRGFFADLDVSNGPVQSITQNELTALLEEKRGRVRFEVAQELLESKLRLLAEQDRPPDLVVLTLPKDLYLRVRVADYRERGLGPVHRDQRRAFKSAAMRYRIPTQIIRASTIDGTDTTHPSKIAWNLLTALYFKAGGVPWAPHGLAPGTCYLGVSFFRPLGKPDRVQASLVQAFDERGEGLVLRGHDFEWDPRQQGRSPHLSAEQAERLVAMALDRYKAEVKQTPRRVVVHKSSRFWPQEREGFRAALAGVSQYDLVALTPQSDLRLLTTATYPPLRSTRFSVGDEDYLYTTGYIASLNEYHAMGTPAPLQIADHVGQDTVRDELLREVLALSKMNWNAANFAGLLPITLRFSELVGEILREIPEDREPLPQFKFYM